MDQELKAKWIEALESGQYEKGKHLLYKSENKTFCCLGVLLAVAGLPYDTDTEGIMNRPCYLPVRKILGIGELDLVTVMHELASKNDTSESFDPVIKIIKEKL